ncbi:MAG: dockerin type I repeat-containing protein, partial [Ruminococcus callidus]|nr:dockerin type I repeat-containing protein [Ruminococcus callidus]
GKDAITSLNSVTVEYEGSTGTVEKTIIETDFDYSGYKKALENFTPDATEPTDAPTSEETTEKPTEATTAVTSATEPATTEATEEVTTTPVTTEATEEVTTQPATDAPTEESTDVTEPATNESSAVASAYGDVNLDEKVTISDAVLLNKYLVKSATLTGTALANADACKDGKVTSDDTLAILKLIVGTYTELPVMPS